MTKLFIDSDIILDLLCQRQDFVASSVLLDLVSKANSGLQGFTTALVFANVHFILCKQIGKKAARQQLIELRKSVGVIMLEETIVDAALTSEGKDFEDNLQMLSAEKAGLDVIITRNKKDYQHSQLPVFSASEFLAKIKS